MKPAPHSTGKERKSFRILWIVAAISIPVLVFAARSLHEDNPVDPKIAAVSAMRTWLSDIDHQRYEHSWTNASDLFRKNVTSDQWVSALTSARFPLGNCTNRKLASAQYKTTIPGESGMLEGNFVIAQFDASFDDITSAQEVVTFEKAPDGTWKADGYYIKFKL